MVLISRVLGKKMKVEGFLSRAARSGLTGFYAPEGDAVGVRPPLRLRGAGRPAGPASASVRFPAGGDRMAGAVASLRFVGYECSDILVFSLRLN